MLFSLSMLFIRKETNQMKYIWMWLWNTFLKLSLEYWNIITNRNQLSLFCKLNCMLIRHLELLLIFMHSAYATEISNRRICWYIQTHMFWISVISDQPKGWWKVKPMFHIFAPDIIEHQNWFLVLPTMATASTCGPLDASSVSFFLVNQSSQEIVVLINLLK